MDVREHLVHYFALEKAWTIGLSLFGAATCALAVALWVLKGPYRASALPIGLFALLELSIGIGVAARTDNQVAELLQRLDTKQDMQSEQVRMARVARNFEVVKIVEVVVFAVGVILTYALRSSDAAFAVGVGLIGQSCALLLFDLVAERRADIYIAALQTLQLSG